MCFSSPAEKVIMSLPALSRTGRSRKRKGPNWAVRFESRLQPGRIWRALVMHEKCDCCGNEVPILEIVFTGRQYLCPQCECLKSPEMMGLAANRGAKP